MRDVELQDRIILGKRMEAGERIEVIAVRHDNGEFEIMDNIDGVILTKNELERLVHWGLKQINSTQRSQLAGAN